VRVGISNNVDRASGAVQVARRDADPDRDACVRERRRRAGAPAGGEPTGFALAPGQDGV